MLHKQLQGGGIILYQLYRRRYIPACFSPSHPLMIISVNNSLVMINNEAVWYKQLI